MRTATLNSPVCNKSSPNPASIDAKSARWIAKNIAISAPGPASRKPLPPSPAVAPPLRAQCLKQVRDSKMLDDLGLTWDESCTDYAGISRRHADNLTRQFDQFGDAYDNSSQFLSPSPTL